jgi:hypothetical protein
VSRPALGPTQPPAPSLAVKRQGHLHLVPRSRMRGTIHLLPHAPSWHDAQLKHTYNISSLPLRVRKFLAMWIAMNSSGWLYTSGAQLHPYNAIFRVTMCNAWHMCMCWVSLLYIVEHRILHTCKRCTEPGPTWTNLFVSSTETRLRAGRLGFNSWRGQWLDFFFSPLRPDRLWGSLSLLINGYQRLLLRSKVAGVLNWSLTST